MNRKKKQRSIILWSMIVLGALASGGWQTNALNGVASDHMPAPITASWPRIKTAVRHLKPVLMPRAAQNVRLRLFADATVHVLTVESAGGLQVLPKPKKVQGVVTLVADGDQVLVRAARKTVMSGSRVRVLSLQEGLIEMHRSKAKGHETNGKLIVTAKNGKLQIVNIIDLESYVMGTVEPELGSLNLPVDALKAQLIASRSYILALQDRHPGQDYDFCDTAHCQVFGGVGHYPRRFTQAAAETRGLYLTYKGKPAAAFYHHSCGGQTAAIEDIWPGPAIPYLRRVQDGPKEAPYCRIGSRQEWVFSIKSSALRQCFVKQRWIRGAEALDALRVIRVNASGRAAQVLVQSSRSQWVPADQFRHAFNSYFGQELLLSTWFTISRVGEGYEFRGRGWGHGVGMCQVGAIYLARHHQTYEQILAHYFPGTQLSRLAPTQKIPRRKDSRLMSYLRSWAE